MRTQKPRQIDVKLNIATPARQPTANQPATCPSGLRMSRRACPAEIGFDIDQSLASSKSIADLDEFVFRVGVLTLHPLPTRLICWGRGASSRTM